MQTTLVRAPFLVQVSDTGTDWHYWSTKHHEGTQEAADRRRRKAAADSRTACVRVVNVADGTYTECEHAEHRCAQHAARTASRGKPSAKRAARKTARAAE